MTAFDQIKLSTQRLLLRPLEAADAPALFEVFSDPRVMRYWSTRPWASIDESHALIERDLKAMKSGEYIRLGLERREDARLLGHCTIFKIDRQCRRAEVGYGLAHRTWGNGYMHEALRALLEFGFSEQPQPRRSGHRSSQRAVRQEPGAARLQEGRLSSRALDRGHGGFRLRAIWIALVRLAFQTDGRT